MSLFEAVYTYAIILIPFLVCLAVYYWLTRKALRINKGPWKFFALLFIAAGIVYTIYSLIVDIRQPISAINFNFIVIMVNAAAFAIISVLMAAGEPSSERDS